MDNNIAFIDVPTIRGNDTVIGVNYTINVCSVSRYLSSRVAMLAQHRNT